ncbi:MAG: hypothetical protein HQK81_00995 [Desulfovibrionaceae bacterium]|nr:hypothetical protein [Desulfovibrionaceae bacterium]MBF0512624.1 hypothetical protein [Desulfovibrionaceae bacterium]
MNKKVSLPELLPSQKTFIGEGRFLAVCGVEYHEGDNLIGFRYAGVCARGLLTSRLALIIFLVATGFRLLAEIPMFF